MANKDAIAAAIAIGQEMADTVLQRRDSARKRRADILATHTERLEFKVQVANTAGQVATASLQTAGFLLAMGDSWFDYPGALFFHDDILQLLETNYGYNVESTAHRGDPVEAMAYQPAGQLYRLSACLDKVLAFGATPKAVLLSGGGDDMAGNEFGMLLNHALSPIGGWNLEIVDGLIQQRLTAAYTTVLTAITSICQQRMGGTKTIPILVHGYDYPVPDGRGFQGGWPFPGPWLQPGFREKLFSDLARNVTFMHDIIDKFNDMLSTLVKEPPFANVHYVDLRNTLSTDLTGNAYQNFWDNELHPTSEGFMAVTDKFAVVLSQLS